MGVRWWWAVGALTGCGRLAFDPLTGDGSTGDGRTDDAHVCSPVGHDEDGDTIDDACDVCPHLPDVTQADGDGDGVGDLCDPEPANPRQRIVLFDPFTALRPEWTGTGAPITADASGLLISASASPRAEYLQPIVPGNDVFVTAGTLLAAGPTYHVEITLFDSAQVAHFYCELYEDPGQQVLMFTYTLDGNTFQNGTQATPAQTFIGGSGRITFAPSPTGTHCESTWRDEPLASDGPVPGIAPAFVGLSATRANVRFDYFVQIRTE